jgi:hypothetical protein
MLAALSLTKSACACHANNFIQMSNFAQLALLAHPSRHQHHYQHTAITSTSTITTTPTTDTTIPPPPLPPLLPPPRRPFAPNEDSRTACSVWPPKTVKESGKIER